MLRPFKSGFTLVELLVVLAIILLLGGLVGGVVIGARKKADQTASLNNLRQMGNAIQLHVGEHNGRLPGPLWPGQVAEFDETREGRLVVDLAPYLGLENPTGIFLVEELLSPAFKRAIPKARWNLGRVYVTNMAVLEDPDSPSSSTFAPFGNLANTVGDEPVEADPQPHSSLKIRKPSSQWALAEADQTHPDVAGASWSADAPATPLHDNRRATLYFDGRVEMVPVASGGGGG